FNVYRVHFTDVGGVVTGAQHDIFVRNSVAGPASQAGLTGLEHPSDVKFSPDGKTMYVLDFGQPPNQGAKTWAITRQAGVPATGGVGPAAAPQTAPAAA